jgi:putative ABC transport system permease protein
MWRNYLKTGLRHLWVYRAFAIINTGGLAIALAGFILVVLYGDHERSYNSWSPRLAHIYEIKEWNRFLKNNADFNSLCNTQIARLLSGRLPGASKITVVEDPDEGLPAANVEINGAMFLEGGLLDSDSSFFNVFPYSFTEGTKEGALDASHSMVITESVARTWFGKTDPLGKTVLLKQWVHDPGSTYHITGIVKDQKRPSTLKFDGVYDSGENESKPENQSVHGANIYILAAEGTDAGSLQAAANRIYAEDLSKALTRGESYLNEFQKTTLQTYLRSGNHFGLRLQPFRDLHLYPGSGQSPMQKILPLALLALMLLCIGIINYTNLATVQAMGRAREIGVRKVLGARRIQVVVQIQLECFLQCVAAMFLALVLVELLLPWFDKEFGVAISLWADGRLGSLAIQLLVILVLTTLLAGAYPALVISGYASARVLKGNFSTGREGNLVRHILVVLQFGIAVVFFTGLVIVNRQVIFLERRDPGFTPEGLINLTDIRDPVLEERLKRIPGVYAVGPNTQVLGDGMDFQIPILYKGLKKKISQASVGIQSLQALGVRVLQGRLFSEKYGQDHYNSIVINESAARELGGDVIGRIIYENDTVAQQIIGVIGDYQFEGFRQEIQPTLYAVNNRGPSSSMPNLLIRYNPRDESRIVREICAAWKAVHPAFLIHYIFLPDQYRMLLEDDMRFLHIIQTFTTVSILLSLMGIFALSAFVSGQRSREIGVRRVFGATVRDILQLLNRDFVILVLIANIVGWPVALVLGRRWLNDFVFRISMPASAFLWAAVLTVSVTIVTVTVQAYRSASANPARTLRHE